MFKRYFHFLILCTILAFYIFIRVKPLQFQTVGYTYDQGRDFLKAAEIFMNKRPTFIGPTTGINGLYHGAWWYYVLLVPYVLFRGSPIGFYYFNLFIHASSLVILFIFVKKYSNLWLAALLSLLIAVSPYFIFTSLFVGNNIMVLPVMVIFLIINFIILEDNKNRHGQLLPVMTGFCLGLIAEFELSFGLFLIPTYFVALLLFNKFRIFFNGKRLFMFISGLAFAFLPRMLFEIKNQFIQTKTLLSFFFKPKLHNPKAYIDVVQDRIMLFKGYWEGLFSHNLVAVLITVLLLLMLILVIKNKIKIFSNALSFFTYLILSLFLLSTLYSDNFWGNYYEGIQYIFVFVIFTVFAIKTKIILWEKVGKIMVILLFVFAVLRSSFFAWKTTPKYEGLAVQRAVVSYILTHEKNTQNYCVRIYTPPVIPHTYNYLFLYERSKRGTAIPDTEWVNGACWFIMEPDPFGFRLKEWKQIHEPDKKAEIKSKKIQNTLINYYRIQ